MPQEINYEKNPAYSIDTLVHTGSGCATERLDDDMYCVTLLGEDGAGELNVYFQIRDGVLVAWEDR